MIFSRHISKTIKSIQPKIYELQDYYKFKFELETNINNIIIIIYLDYISEKHILDLIGKKIKEKLLHIWQYQITDYSKKTIKIILNSVS